MIVDEKGDEINPPKRACPKCGKSDEKAKKVNAFGGHWSMLCPCGYEFESGRDPR